MSTGIESGCRRGQRLERSGWPRRLKPVRTDCFETFTARLRGLHPVGCQTTLTRTRTDVQSHTAHPPFPLMMDVIRTFLAIGLTFVAYKHSFLWGRFFMNLHGIKSPAEVSMAYLRPATRFAVFTLPIFFLLVIIWLLWPYGHWGLLAIVTSAWGFKAGMRCELLRSFVQLLLLRLDDGLPFEAAWLEAESTISAISGIRDLSINRHAVNPGALVHYVARTTRSRSEAQEIAGRWLQWLESQGIPDS